MKKFINLTTFALVLCMLASMACACSSKKDEEETAAQSVVAEAGSAETTSAAVAPSVASTDATTAAATTEAAATTTTAAATTAPEVTKPDSLTDEMALDAIHTYCVMQNTGFADLSADHWQIISSTDAQIVVLFTSYTGSENRYYVDRASGNTYVTELVPGIIDEEQKTGETFNAKDHLSPEIYR